MSSRDGFNLQPRARRIAWRLVRQGGRHEVWQCGSTKLTIPRHREVNELIAGAIVKALEPELGPGLVEAMKRKTYTARCQRAGDWWAISVPELRGVHTQARRLQAVEAMARDAFALFLDIDPDSFDLRLEPVLPHELQKKVGRSAEGSR